MHFLDIPKEVIDDSVLKYLKWNDLLRFRRVCKWTKGITDGYLWVIPKRAPEIEINEGDKTLEAFVTMGIPTARIYLNNAQSGYYFYKQIEEETQHQFLELYAPHVQFLHVAQMTLWLFGRELDFIDGMKNLKGFEAGYFGHGRKIGGDGEWDEDETAIILASLATNSDPRLTNHGLPKIFKKLEGIIIGLDPYGFYEKFNVLDRCCHTLLNCTQLRCASLPYDTTFKTSELRGAGDGDVHTVLGKAFVILYLYIKERPNEVYTEEDAGKMQLEVFDFENYHRQMEHWTIESTDESYAKLPVLWFGSQLFMQMVARALETGVKLRNVHASWFCARFKDEFGDMYASPELGHPVVSLVGLDPCVMQLDMPNLENVWIPGTSGFVTGNYPRPDWPKLKGLDIIVDGTDGYMWDVDRKRRFSKIKRVIHRATTGLFEFLFGDGIVRGNMSGLSIRFVEEKEKNEVTVPRTEEIGRSCPNLKRIVLTNWMGTNKQLVVLWKGLLELEAVYLYNCKELGNVAFVGEDVGNPVFLGLKNLKKLSLKGLDKMPKVTDTLFCMVLSKMKLKELVVTSDGPVENVTKKGINALLEGPFAETIERFPFQDWSLADMTAEEFQDMGKKFRSYDMI